MKPDKNTRRPWLAYNQPSAEAKLRLFRFPFSGGASFYRNWLQNLPEGIDVCPIQLPDRETRIREKTITRIKSLIDELSAALLPWRDKPYCLFGRSMGALVIFELPRYLAREHGSSAGCLFVSGFNATQLEYKSALRRDLTENEFIVQLSRMEGTPKEVIESPELMQLLFPVLQADCAVCDFYTYYDEPALACTITVYGGGDDHETPRVNLESWCVQSNSQFDCRIFMGGHFFLQSSLEKFMPSLASELILKKPAEKLINKYINR